MHPYVSWLSEPLCSGIVCVQPDQCKQFPKERGGVFMGISERIDAIFRRNWPQHSLRCNRNHALQQPCPCKVASDTLDDYEMVCAAETGWSVHLGPVSWRLMTIKWQQFSQSNRHSTIPPSALDKPSIMKRYHRQRTTRWDVTAHSPTMVALHDTRFVECRWWNGLDCENCCHLAVVGLHDTGPWCPSSFPLYSRETTGFFVFLCKEITCLLLVL